jgi:parvulin-like peptidyl-prolyl isomerase
MNPEILQIGGINIYKNEVPSLLQRYQVIPQIKRGIVIDQAISNIFLTESESATAIYECKKCCQITSDHELKVWLQNQGMTLEKMQELAIRALQIEKFKIATWGKKVESYFLKRKASLNQVIYSLIRHQDSEITSEIYFRIQAEEQSFTELAREYSQGLEVHTSGIIGPVLLNQLDPIISNILSVSQPGQLWSPRPMGQWFIILRLEKLLPAQLDEMMRRRLIDELFEQWLNEQVKQLSGESLITLQAA